MRTGLTVNTDQKGLIAERLHILPIVLGDVLRHLADTVLALEEILQVHRPFEDLVQLIDVGHTLGLGQRQKLLFECFMRYQHLIGCKVVVQRQGCAVSDAVGDGILVQVTPVILAAKGLEGATSVGRLVHRGAGETDIAGIRQTGHQEIAQIATGGAVRLIDQHIEFARVLRFAGISRNLWIMVTIMPR